MGADADIQTGVASTDSTTYTIAGTSGAVGAPKACPFYFQAIASSTCRDGLKPTSLLIRSYAMSTPRTRTVCMVWSTICQILPQKRWIHGVCSIQTTVNVSLWRIRGCWRRRHSPRSATARRTTHRRLAIPASMEAASGDNFDPLTYYRPESEILTFEYPFLRRTRQCAGMRQSRNYSTPPTGTMAFSTSWDFMRQREISKNITMEKGGKEND